MSKRPMKCPYCGCMNYVNIPKGAGPRNPHKWDGSPKGSFWRNCEETTWRCRNCKETFHIDVH